WAGRDGGMGLAEAFWEHVVATVPGNRRSELAALGRDIAPLERVRKPFPRITYAEAIETLAGQGLPVAWGADLGADEETALSNAFDRPVMVHRYPVEAKAFYMKT